MKKTIGKWLAAFSFCLLATQCWSQRVKPCNIYGTVCIVKDRLQADYIVYVEETESFANLVVYREDNPLYADKSGIWYLIDQPQLAHYRVFVETVKGRADFTIYYTDTSSFAGCQ